jgi:hypothetical protein
MPDGIIVFYRSWYIFFRKWDNLILNPNYTKGAYGPYLINLKHLPACPEGYYIKGQIRFQDMKPAGTLQLSEDKIPEVMT